MNQIGTISETLAAVHIAQDAFMSDLAVAVGPGQINVGAIARSERLAKYNRLFRIDELGRAPLAQPFSTR